MKTETVREERATPRSAVVVELRMIGSLKHQAKVRHWIREEIAEMLRDKGKRWIINGMSGEVDVRWQVKTMRARRVLGRKGL